MHAERPVHRNQPGRVRIFVSIVHTAVIGAVGAVEAVEGVRASPELMREVEVVNIRPSHYGTGGSSL